MVILGHKGLMTVYTGPERTNGNTVTERINERINDWLYWKLTLSSRHYSAL